uniref:AMSH-like protease-like protein n=1 Tax=Callorhinchus milii TaxID=7868 RepID=V9KSS3_CALMI|eukprot:gi/632936466/ref/XP_007895026.1/ PREDICTED: AMSH-like protease isoform X2 [Callorhinchus milii]
MDTSSGSSKANSCSAKNMNEPYTFTALKKLVAVPDHTDVSLSPVERVRVLTKLGCNIEISEDITPRRYFRSGVEMIRMASVYMKEGNLENAFVLYNKFITLFVEKLPKHRDYQLCAIPEKQDILKKLKEVAFPRADELKIQLISKYSGEHENYYKNQSKSKEGFLDNVEQNQVHEEKERIAKIRQQQLQEEQFRFFEEQLKRQDAVKVQQKEVNLSFSEQSDGGILNCIAAARINNEPSTVMSSAAQPMCPPVDRSLKPRNNASRKSIVGLRNVVLPKDLCQRFLIQADTNTVREIETCGILSGKLTNDEFIITHVIIPKQSGGPDYCDTENEEELFTFQDQHDLITLGWIHTHPTQTAFLSSVDLHTHCSYQLMLPEAIAIVCAPKRNDTGFFQLSFAGMLEVSSCKKKGFHPHMKDPPLYHTCSHLIRKDMNTIISDMR